MVIGALRPASAWAAGSFETVPQGLSAVPIQAVQSICNTPVSAIAGIKNPARARRRKTPLG